MCVFSVHIFVYRFDWSTQKWKMQSTLNIFYFICKALVLLWPMVTDIYSNLYYYSSPVHKNMSSKFDEFLAMRSQFDNDHRVDFYAHTCCQSATYVPLFAFYCPLFFYEKN